MSSQRPPQFENPSRFSLLSRVAKNINRRFDPIGCSCSAYMKIRSTESDPSMVTITYNRQHDGHTPGSVRDMASAPISAGARNAWGRLIENKMDWRSIKHLIRSDQRTLGNIMNSGAPLPESVRIDSNAVYYAMAKRMEKLANLDKNLASSLDLWKKKITDSGGHCFTRGLDSINSGMGVVVSHERITRRN